MSIPENFNSTMHPLFTTHVMRAYRRKSLRVEKTHPELFRPVDVALSKQHRELWSRTGLPCGDRWLRVHVNLTGISDYRFCPEDIFFARIERVLNDCNQSSYGVEEKNELWRYVPKGAEPKTILRFVRGSFYDGENNWIGKSAAQEALHKSAVDLIGKPCKSSGGDGVRLFRYDGTVHRDNDTVLTSDWILSQNESYVVQEKIQQCAFCASFNPDSVNTLRMMTMRCPWDGQIVTCRSMMRIGVSDAIADNMMKGGLCVCIGDHGQFGKFAYDYDGKRYERHPKSNLEFSGLTYPKYDEIVSFAKEIHRHILFYNLLSFDFVVRNDGTLCVVEINATSQGITQLQYDFGGLFGDYTEQVVDWVSSHLEYDNFAHLRTWY